MCIMHTKDSNFAIGLIFTISLVPKCRSCLTSKTAEGLTLANCTNLNLHETPKLPDDVQIVDFSKNPNLELREYFLAAYSNTLVRLILRENYYASFLKPGMKGLTLNVFTKLTNLEEFDFSLSELNSDHQWVLPKGLKKYNVSYNYYFYLDVSSGTDLEDLSLEKNFISYLPKFHHPLPPLIALRMKHNPFNKLSVLDIAPFCYLRVLELEFPADAELAKAAGFCNCTLLKVFAEEMNIEGISDLNCYNGTQAQEKPCSNNTLIEARKIRKKCPIATMVVSSALITILKFVFFSTLFLLFLATLILYVIRHFHLRERWSGPHNLLPNDMHEEEQEQSLQDPGSTISDGSISGSITP